MRPTRLVVALGLCFAATHAYAQPTHVQAEIVSTASLTLAGVPTDPTWNPNLPKLTGDGSFIYAVHTYFPETSTTQRFTVILRRSANLSQPIWTEMTNRVTSIHQNPGIVMDVHRNLHLVFNCQRQPSGAIASCYYGGANSAGNTLRFYHLIFNTRNPDGSVRFDTYANYNEFTAENNGYFGIGTFGGAPSAVPSPGTTFWSFSTRNPGNTNPNDTDDLEQWDRIVQWSFDNGGPHQSGAWPKIDSLAHDRILLYPVMAGHLNAPEPFVLFFGESDPETCNARYNSAALYAGPVNPAPFSRRHELTPTSADCEVCSTRAFSSDVAFDSLNVLFALGQRAQSPVQKTELLRFGLGTIAPPTEVREIGPLGNYAKIQFSNSGKLYLFATSTSTNGKIDLAMSTDQGASWTWYCLPIQGIPTTNKRFLNFTPIKPYTAPLLYNADRMLFMFSGDSFVNGAYDNKWTTYMGWIDLP